jgi:hypothetical protein
MWTTAASAPVGSTTLRQVISASCSLVHTPALADLMKWSDERFRTILGDLAAILAYDDIDPTLKSASTPTPFVRKERQLRAAVLDAAGKALASFAQMLSARLDSRLQAKSLFVGRLAYGMAFGVPNLQKLVGSTGALSAAKSELCNVCAASLAIWIKPTAESLVVSFQRQLASEDWEDQSRKSSWEAGVVNEGTSTEDRVEPLPTQTTAALWSLLFGLS